MLRGEKARKSKQTNEKEIHEHWAEGRNGEKRKYPVHSCIAGAVSYSFVVTGCNWTFIVDYSYRKFSWGIVHQLQLSTLMLRDLPWKFRQTSLSSWELGCVSLPCCLIDITSTITAWISSILSGELLKFLQIKNVFRMRVLGSHTFLLGVPWPWM